MEKNIKVYEALAKARLMISESPITKSGQTATIKFKNGGAAPARNYLSLKDISGVVTAACAEHKLTYALNMTTEEVILTVYSCEDGSTMDFKVPANMVGSEVNMGNGGGSMHPIQRLGSNITYLRRYMLCTAFEIVENDNIEGTEQIEVNDSPQQAEQEAQQKAEQEAKKQADLINKARAHFHAVATKYIETHPTFTMEQIAQMCGMAKGVSYEQMNKAITVIESMAGVTTEPTQQAEQGANNEQEANYTKANF